MCRCVKFFYLITTAMSCVAQMVAGVAHIHSRGVAHLDVKPANFIVSQGFKVKLIDFGLAQIIPGSGLIDNAGGTPGYRAPEILRGRGR